MHIIIDRDAAPEPWKGCREYKQGAVCTHKGKSWRCTVAGGIYNPAFEPGGFAPYGWEKI